MMRLLVHLHDMAAGVPLARGTDALEIPLRQNAQLVFPAGVRGVHDLKTCQRREGFIKKMR